MTRRWRLVLVVVAAAVAAIWLALFAAVGGDFYKTVDEAKRSSPAGPVRVGGTVAPDSIVQRGSVVRFELEGGAGERLAVVYEGPYPDRLGPYEQVVASGSLAPRGELRATQVLVKCPSKLLPERASAGLLETLGLRRLLY